MTWVYNRLIEAHLVHAGPIIGKGFVAPTAKRNHRPVIIPGWWAVRRCLRCGEVYSRTEDLLVPGLLPGTDLVQEFEEQYDGDLAA